MVNRCCIVGCRSVTHDRHGKKVENGLTFHRFPAWRRTHGDQVSDITKSRRLAWVAAVRRTDISFHSIPVSMRVCSLHFHSGKPANEMYTTHPDWAPSLHLGHTEVKATNAARYERRESRKRQKTESTPAVEDDPGDLIPPVETPGPSSPEDGADQGVETECDFCQIRRDEINRLLEENRALKQELDQRKMDEYFLKDDSSKVKYYTGLPHFEVLAGLLACVEPHITHRSKIVTPFQLLFMTLMRLRLNLPMQHVAYIFGVERGCVSKTFRSMVDVLHARIGPLTDWPGRDALCATMPGQFAEAFGKRVVVILDCFEISTLRPPTPKAQAKSDSHGKHDTAVKYLVGVTPRGSTCFVSKGFRGRVSDKHVLDSCGILDKLSPGDLVLANRGFDVEDSAGLMCAEVKVSGEGRRELEATDLQGTKKIAHLQLQVGRAAGKIRSKYTILSAKVPTPMEEDAMFLDKTVCVCCALTNMCPSVELK